MPSDPAVWDRLAQRYAAVDGLHPAEEALMRRLADRWPAVRFDFVQFSYNGIDCVPAEDRPTILREIRRVIRDDGLSFFSSHSLFAFPLQGDAFPRLSIARPDKALYKLTLYAYRSVRFALVNRSIDVEAARRIGFAPLGDGGHGFRMKLVYVTPGVPDPPARGGRVRRRGGAGPARRRGRSERAG